MWRRQLIQNLVHRLFLLLNSVYTVLPLSQGLDRVKGGTIHMKTVKYVHKKLWLSVYTEYIIDI